MVQYSIAALAPLDLSLRPLRRHVAGAKRHLA